MHLSTPPDLAAFAGFGLLALLVYLLFLVGAAALGMWIFYTVMWRAVRRGLREFHRPGRPGSVGFEAAGRSPWGR